MATKEEREYQDYLDYQNYQKQQNQPISYGYQPSAFGRGIYTPTNLSPEQNEQRLKGFVSKAPELGSLIGAITPVPGGMTAGAALGAGLKQLAGSAEGNPVNLTEAGKDVVRTGIIPEVGGKVLSGAGKTLSDLFTPKAAETVTKTVATPLVDQYGQPITKEITEAATNPDNQDKLKALLGLAMNASKLGKAANYAKPVIKAMGTPVGQQVLKRAPSVTEAAILSRNNDGL